MTSFVNMMASDIWSDQDINRRVQSLIRSRFTQEDELKAARLSRQETKTETESAFISSVDDAIDAALTEGHNARVDRDLLNLVLGVEAQMRVLSQPVLQPVLGEDFQVSNQEDIDLDSVARVEAQAHIDAASVEVMDWVNLRNPPSEVLTEEPV